MVAKTYIEPTLQAIHKQFKVARHNKEFLMFSKLAIIELGGWTEETIDDLVLRFARKRLNSNDIREYKRIVTDNYGFSYKKNFKPLLCNLVGRIGFVKLEESLDTLVRQQLESALNNLKVSRDKAAHTHIKNATVTIDAPSLTLSRFKLIYTGLKAFEKGLVRTI